MFDCILECSGIGAKTFLQGQLTCNINDLKANQPQITACCNLQGRVIFTAYVLMKNEQSFLLMIPKSMKNIVVSHLEKYARFSRCCIVEIEMGERHSPLQGADVKINIIKGIPTIYPETSEQIIAQRLNLHLIEGAISFKKGCYLGQEIIARLHFKGTLKHHMILGKVPCNTSVKHGDPVLDDENNVVGTIIDFCIQKDQILLLFVNLIENKNPHLENASKVEILPYDPIYSVTGS